jgi:hypothetical protein
VSSTTATKNSLHLQALSFVTLEALAVPNPKAVSDPEVGDLQQRLGLVSEAEFAALRGVKVSALWNERSLGKGPTFERWGRKIYYPMKEIEKYRAACTIRPTRTPTLIDGVLRRRRSSAKA